MSKETRRLVIHGRVQGVGFRYSMVEQAEKLGLTGWVRNKQDGSVEAIVQGLADRVNQIIAWANQGPAGSQVERVDVENADGNFDEFSIDPSSY